MNISSGDEFRVVTIEPNLTEKRPPGIGVELAYADIAMLETCIAPFGCASSLDQVMKTEQSAVQLRSYQERAFDTSDKEQTLRSVIATLQDLSFVLDKADLDLGVVSATKLSGYQMRITVIVRPRGSSQLIVRANAQIDDDAVVEPKPYQDFFTALEKAMFLTAHEVD